MFLLVWLIPKACQGSQMKLFVWIRDQEGPWEDDPSNSENNWGQTPTADQVPNYWETPRDWYYLANAVPAHGNNELLPKKGSGSETMYY